MISTSTPTVVARCASAIARPSGPRAVSSARFVCSLCRLRPVNRQPHRQTNTPLPSSHFISLLSEPNSSSTVLQPPSWLATSHRSFSSASPKPAEPEPKPDHDPASSSSSSSPSTANPDGITILPRAAEKLRLLATSNKARPVRLRIAVLPGGCHGFQYIFKLETIVPPVSPSESTPDQHQQQQQQQRPTIVATAATTGTSAAASAADFFPPEDDVQFGDADADGTGGGGAPVVIDRASLDVVAGSKLDYSMDLIGNQFVIKDIPGSTSSCGCGSSFDVSV